MSETSYLRETLNRRAKSLAHLRPLFDLEANKGRYPELPLDKLDIFRFASALLDVIVTEMGGFHRGATYEQILSVLTPQFRQAIPSLDSTQADRIEIGIESRQVCRSNFFLPSPSGSSTPRPSEWNSI